MTQLNTLKERIEQNRNYMLNKKTNIDTLNKMIIIEHSKSGELALIWMAIMLLCCMSGCYYTVKCGTGPNIHL